MALSLISSTLQMPADGRDGVVVFLSPGLQRSNPTAFSTADIYGDGGFMPRQTALLARQKATEACIGLQLYLWGYKWAKSTGWKEILKDEDCLLPQAEFLQRHLSIWVLFSIDDPDLKNSSIWGVTKYIHLRIWESLGHEFRSLEKYLLPGRKRKTQRLHWFWGRGWIVHISSEAHSAL